MNRSSSLRLGLLTLGQAPREDITMDLKKLLPGVEFIEKGLLDGLTREEVVREFYQRGDIVYPTRMKDGSEVKLSRSRILGLVEKRLKELEKNGVNLIVLLCTREFPQYVVEVPVIYPGELLRGIVSSLKIGGVLGVLAPSEEQVPYLEDIWSKVHGEVEVVYISPYTSTRERFIEIGRKLKSMNVSMVVMDCLGYTLEHRDILRGVLGSKAIIINPREAIAKTIEMLF